MKLLFLTDGIFPYEVGGMQKHSAVLAKLLSERGVDLTLVHPGGKGYTAEHFSNHFKLTTGQVTEVVVPFPPPGRFPGHYIRANRNYSKRIYNQLGLSLSEFDLIYAQGFTASAFITARKKGLLHIPVIVNLHGLEMFQAAPDLKMKIAYRWLKKEARYNLEGADFVYSFGGQLDDVLRRLKIPAGKILHQRNGIEADWLIHHPVNQPVFTFLFIGRSERRKGIPELNKALSGLLAIAPRKFRFHFIGPFAGSEKLDHAALTYHGEIRDAEKIRSIIDQCDCLVCPSHSEGMPTVILEAMARGVAILATNVGAVSRQVKENGMLLGSPEPVQLADAMQKFIELPGKELLAMKMASVRIVRDEFLWSKIADQKMADFRKITEG